MLKLIQQDVRDLRGVARAMLKRRGDVLTVKIWSEAGNTQSFDANLQGDETQVRMEIRAKAKNTIDDLRGQELEQD